MNLIRIIWPSITDTESANKASNIAWITVWVLNVISTINLVVSYCWIRFATHKEFSIDKVMLGIIGILVFALIGYFIKRNNKIAAFLPFILMIVFGTGPNIIIGVFQLIKIVFMGGQFEPVYFGSWYGITSAIILTILYLNGIRGVFAHHRFAKIALNNQRKEDDGRWTI